MERSLTIVAISATYLVLHFLVLKCVMSQILVHLVAAVHLELLKMKRMNVLLLTNVGALTKIKYFYQGKFMKKNVKIGKFSKKI